MPRKTNLAAPPYDDLAGIDFDPDFDDAMSDREVLCSIWMRSVLSDQGASEGWGMLAERYPDESRFVLLGLFAEILEHLRTLGPDFSADYVLRKLNRLRADGTRVDAGALIDLFAVIHGSLRGKMSEREARAFDALAAEIGTLPSPTDAERRLAALVRAVLVEGDVRTLDGQRWDRAASRVNESHDADPEERDYAEWMARTEGAEEVAYATSAQLKPGQRVRHAKFGIGVVIAVETGRADVLFADALRRLACT